MYNYLFSPHVTRCYGLLRTVLFKLYVFGPYNFSFIVYPSVLDDLPPVVAVASSSSCPDLLRVFNYIVRVSKTAVYLLRGEVHVDFSSSNVDDCFNVLRNGLPMMTGRSNLSSLMSITLKSSGAECMLVVGTWFHAGADK